MKNTKNPIFDEYDDIFFKFIERLTGYPEMTAWARVFIDSLPEQPRSLLSIGAGNGHYDESLLEYIMPTLDYWALEPNPVFFEALTKRSAAWKASGTHIFSGYFDDTVELSKEFEREFDFVLMTHCVYFMSSPAKALERARGFLSRGGHVLVHHQCESALSEIFMAFSRQNGWIPGVGRQDHGMTIETISENLKKTGIRHFVAQRPAVVFVDEFFANKTDTESREVVIAMLKFFLDVDVTNWPKERLEEATDFIKARSSRNPASNRYEFPHPEGFLVIPHPENGFIPSDMQLVE
uniref:Methyltransferase domain-containing protein n=1 Tax=Candidatus Kentrum sp. LFY TaxID=2126342 RepID=A0A450UE52_9GAMM|nr:MAG: Methyltransferase domain-containing protein [Candidatus Kentron sp. LFY]